MIGEIKHHCGKNKLELLSYENKCHENIVYRGEILEQDLRTLNNALLEIQKISKEKDYKEITNILEKRVYEQGHNF